MNASRFDHLARALARGTSRRQVLHASVATVIGGAVIGRQTPGALAQCSWSGTYEAPFGGAITMTLQETGSQVDGSYLFSDGATSVTGTISGVVRTDFPGYTVLDGYWQEPPESGRIWFSMPLDTCATFAGSFTGTETSEQWTPGWDGARTSGGDTAGGADEITLFSNPGDSRVAALTIDGHPTTLFGQKAADGSLEYLDHVQMDAPNGDPLQQVLLDFDAAGNMTRAALGSGESMRFDVVDPLRTIITYQSADGSQEIQFPFDTSAAAASAPGVVAESLVSSTTGRMAFTASPHLAHALADDSLNLPAAQDSVGNRGKIEVRCATGQLINTYVSGWYIGSNPKGQLVELRFNWVSTGVYEYVVPLTKAPELDTQKQVSRLKMGLSSICSVSLGMTLTGTSSAVLCGLLIEAPPAAATCAAFVAAYRVMCGVNTAWNFGLGPVIDALSEELEVTAQAHHPGLGHKEIKVTAEAREPIPTGVITIADAAAISTMFTKPIDPSPGEGYVVLVNTVCAPNGAHLKVSVAGTDNFTAATDATLSDTVTGTELSVPGGSQGIQDTITVQLTGGVSDTKTRVIVF